MNCPKCKSSMEKVQVQNIEVDRCVSCNGIWFDILEDEKLKIDQGSENIDKGDVQKGKELNRKQNINCPRCHTMMITMVVSPKSNIEIETCTICNGAFYDAGEFKDLVDQQESSIFETIKHLFKS